MASVNARGTRPNRAVTFEGSARGRKHRPQEPSASLAENRPSVRENIVSAMQKWKIVSSYLIVIGKPQLCVRERKLRNCLGLWQRSNSIVMRIVNRAFYKGAMSLTLFFVRVIVYFASISLYAA
jgi:hypothetical protein